MGETGVVLVFFLVGVVFLIAEIFIPSHGILSIVGIGFLIFGIYRTYDLSTGAGHASLLGSIVFVPTLAVIAVKYFHRTPLGRKIAPDNPQLDPEDFAPAHEALKAYIGMTGTAITPLRPVGVCSFDGKRVDCVAESGMIDKDAEVQAIGLRGQEVEVRERTK